MPIRPVPPSPSDTAAPPVPPPDGAPPGPGAAGGLRIGSAELVVPDPGDWDAWYERLELAFGGVPEPAEEKALWRRVLPAERMLGFRDPRAGWAATAAAFRFRLTVPGGAAVPAAGVTMVSVTATHRRRGLLTALMRRQLEDVRAWGEPLAVLTASEPPIYGRFGYGLATYQLSARIDTARVRMAVPPGTGDVLLRWADPAAAVADCERVYARVAAARPGMLVRQPGWERLPLLDPVAGRGGASPLQCVLAERDGEVVGYARFRNRPDWDAAGPAGAVVLRDLEALDPAGYAALWRFLCEIDLTESVRTHSRPVDDAWQHLVSDVRRCEVRLRDGLFLRPVELGAALGARTYQCPVDVVLDVADPCCPWNEGRWRLSGDEKGAVCSPTRDAPDLALSVREVGSAYLGGVALASLAAAGRVRELRGGALARASAAFSSDVAPWLPHGF